MLLLVIYLLSIVVTFMSMWWSVRVMPWMKGDSIYLLFLVFMFVPGVNLVISFSLFSVSVFEILDNNYGFSNIKEVILNLFGLN